MRAIVWTEYGPPEGLRLQEVEKPVPKDNEVLIRIRATTVTAGDCEMRSLQLPLWIRLPMRFYVGLLKPKRMKILGQELAGEIEEIGKGVTRFEVGDPVFGATGFGLGGYAEYICLPEEAEDGALARKPSNMSYVEAAAVPFGGLEALHFIRKGGIEAGERVLINGAGGSIGTFAVQLAKHYGAEVTAVDRGEKLAMLRSIGADRVVDYTQEDYMKTGDSYHVIFDVIGKSLFAASLRSLKSNGRLLLANPRPPQMILGPWISMRGDKKVVAGPAVRTTADLLFLKELIEAGEIETVVDRTFPLEQVAEAHRYFESGRKVGNLVITVTAPRA